MAMLKFIVLDIGPISTTLAHIFTLVYLDIVVQGAILRSKEASEPFGLTNSYNQSVAKTRF